MAALAASLLAACGEPPCGREVGDLCTVAGTGELGFNGDGHAPADTELYLPSAARRGPDGALYLMDFNNQRLRRIGDDGRVETMIGSGLHAIAATGVPLLETPLENPIDFAFLADGRLVFVSYHDPRVLVVDGEGTLQTLAGADDGVTGTVGDEGDGGPAIAALFRQLDGIAVAPDDTIYLSDSLANRVRKIEGGVIETVVGTGEAAFTGDGGPATAAALHWPTALELDAQGNLYVADTLNHAVRRVSTDGRIETIAGIGSPGHDGDGGPALAASLDQPFGLALADDGTLYIADRGNLALRRVDPQGIIETVAGDGGEATLGHLARLALDGDRLLIADQSGARIWELVLR